MYSLLAVLVKLSVLAKWLARKIPLRKPYRGEGFVSAKPRLKSVYDFVIYVLFHCFMMCLSCPRPYVTDFILMARYNVFVLKMLLNTNQLTTNFPVAKSLVHCHCIMLHIFIFSTVVVLHVHVGLSLNQHTFLCISWTLEISQCNVKWHYFAGWIRPSWCSIFLGTTHPSNAHHAGLGAWPTDRNINIQTPYFGTYSWHK